MSDATPDSNTDPQNTFYRKNITKEKWKEEFYHKTIRELQTEERYTAFFKQFDPASVETFIKDYARRKVLWFSEGENLKTWEQSKRNHWMKDCFVALIEIQQKKLFNAQCLWRAEKIQLPGISIGYDFMYWQDHIFACKAITPITQQDIDLYIGYLRETPFNEAFDQPKNYQDYDEMMEIKRESDNVFEENPWYTYYDEKEGTGSYFDLPDVRGAKENVYRDIFWEDQRQNSSQEMDEQRQSSKSKPYFSMYDGDFLPEFVKRHESLAFYRLFQQDQRIMQLHELNEQPELCISLLEEIPFDYLAVEPADDWRVAVTCTYERYRREKIIELLPQAYALYLKHKGRDWNYPGRSKFNAVKDDPDKGLSIHYLKMILQGRLLNGEPADLNF